MTRTLGLTLLVSAWAIVLVGMRYDHLAIVVFGKPVPFAYLGAPLLGGALVLLLRGMAPRRPRD